MRQIRKRITYANFTSLLAIAIALGTGTVWAANQLPPKSVGTKQLRDGAVTADKLRKNSVTDPKIKAGAVDASKVANGAVVSAKIAAGAVTGEKIVNGAVTNGKFPDNSVTGNKVDEASLSQVPSAAAVERAPFAVSANPEAFVEVTKAGAVVAAGSKGIGAADVKKGELAGIYCVNVPGFAPKGVQATPLPLPEGEGGPDTKVWVFAKLAATSCPPGQIEVRTYAPHEMPPFFKLKEEPFYLMAYR